MAMYNEYLTPYAFSIVKSQFEKMAERSSYDFERCQTDESYILKCANSSSIKVLKNNCGCHFMSKIRLPCWHIMKLRSFLSLAVFDTNIVNQWWTTECYNLFLEREIVQDFRTIATRKRSGCLCKWWLQQINRWRKSQFNGSWFQDTSRCWNTYQW